MSNDPIKIPSTNTDPSDSLGVIFNESRRSEKTEQDSEKTPVSQKINSSFSPTKKSVKSFEEDSLEAGTIVSDKRRDRATLAQNLQSAFTEWWTGTKRSLERGYDSALELSSSNTPVETIIPTAETRADTIKEAAVYASQAPKDDHSHVREKILTELREEPPHKSEPIHIKEVSAQPKENVWTHTVLEQKIDAPLSHDTRTPVAKEISETKTVVSQIVKTTPAQAKTVSQTRPPFQSPGYVASRLEGMPVKPTFGVPKSRDTAPSPTPTEELVSPKASPFPGTATRLPTKQNVDSLQNLPPLTLSQTDVSQNNTLRKIIKWIILFCIVLIGAGLAFFASTRFNIFEEPAIITPEETFVIIPKIFETDTQTALTLPEEKSLFLSDLNSKIQNAPQGISQFYPVVNSNTERHAATTEEIFSLLDTQLPNTAIRALANTMIMGSVTTSKNEPFIVLQSSRFDVLFSGLLSWEHYLQGDLSPLFGDTASSEKFTDVTIANKSVRVLKDAQGNEILLYAFIDQTTVVISTSRDALLKIVERF